MAHCAVRNCFAFTLLELLIVIVIIGLLATIGLPAIRGMTKSNAVVAADRQMLDDIAYARRLAIANHTTVYMLFVPPDVQPFVNVFDPSTFNNDPRLLATLTNLWQGQYTTYALFSFRSVGDQPGLPWPHYWTSWKSLPPGMYIATNKFYYSVAQDGQPYAPPFWQDRTFPFPTVTNTTTTPITLPYIAFNYLGQLVHGASETLVSQGSVKFTSVNYEYIPLAHGSIFYPRDANGNFTPGPPDLQETPPGNAYYESFNSPAAANGQPLPNPTDAPKTYNQIYVDPLTGKARVQRQEVQ